MATRSMNHQCTKSARVFAGVQLLSKLTAGGVAVIQMPTYIVGQHFTVAEYLSSQQSRMEMNAIPQRVIYEVVEQAGCKLIEVREDEYMGGDIGLSHTFVIQRSFIL